MTETTGGRCPIPHEFGQPCNFCDTPADPINDGESVLRETAHPPTGRCQTEGFHLCAPAIWKAEGRLPSGTAPMPTRGIDRDLLRRAGEHLGTLAEEARVRYELERRYHKRTYERWVKLRDASYAVLELANER